MRSPIFQREKVAYIKLRRLGYSISVIAKAFGRSTSVIHRYIRRNIAYGVIAAADLRKIPARVRRLSLSRQWTTMLRWIAQWERWICGEGEKPP